MTTFRSQGWDGNLYMRISTRPYETSTNSVDANAEVSGIGWRRAPSVHPASVPSLSSGLRDGAAGAPCVQPTYDTSVPSPSSGPRGWAGRVPRHEPPTSPPNPHMPAGRVRRLGQGIPGRANCLFCPAWRPPPMLSMLRLRHEYGTASVFTHSSVPWTLSELATVRKRD